MAAKQQIGGEAGYGEIRRLCIKHTASNRGLT